MKFESQQMLDASENATLMFDPLKADVFFVENITHTYAKVVLVRLFQDWGRGLYWT